MLTAVKRCYGLFDQYFFKYQFLRFVTVGTIATVVDFGVLTLLVEKLAVFYLLAATVSFILANLVNFWLSKHWTFRNKSERVVRQYMVFVLVGAIGLLINNGILYLGVEAVGLFYLLAKVLATAAVMLWNFFINKYVTFRESVNE